MIIIISLPSHVLVIRSAAIDIVGSDFVAATKAQGLSNRMIINRVLRNSLIPSLTQMFLSVGYLIGGIITIEYAFSYPGMGTIIAQSVAIEDFPVMQAGLLRNYDCSAHLEPRCRLGIPTYRPKGVVCRINDSDPDNLAQLYRSARIR